MTDILLELSKRPEARRLVKSLGLPLPMPQALARAKAPRVERELAERRIAFATFADSGVLESVGATLARSGADIVLSSDDGAADALASWAEAYARPVSTIDPEGTDRFDGLVFDATGIERTEDLDAVYAFFHPLMGRVAKCARALVIARPPEDASTAGAFAARRAVEGFVRSLAKELGKGGATAQLLYVAEGAEDRLPGALRFFLSPRSAYVTGQPVRVTGRAKSDEAAAWELPLSNKTVLVTGAARGIGRATAELLAGEGAHVIVLDRPADLDAASKVARAIGGSALGVDVTAEDAAAEIADGIRELRGKVDVIVHNAGVTRDKTLKRMKPELWDLTLDVNLNAVQRITTHLLDEGLLSDQGRVICLSSIAGIAGNMGQTNYATAKSGVIGYVRFMADHLAERGITVNAVAPGFIETRMTDAMPVAIREVARRMNALGQGGRPQDVGELITFLATPEAQGVTGEVIRVCGGSLVGA